MRDLLPVSEVFGPVWQGEGPHTGRVVHFLRLGLCNLHCSWCDTPFTWDRTRFDVEQECPPRDARWIIDRLAGASTVVLSGGEPLIHQGNVNLRLALDAIDAAIHVETNGTLLPSAYLLRRVEHFTVSPKVNPQGDPEHRRLHPAALIGWASLTRSRAVAWKIVCSSAEEVREAAAFLDRYDVPAAARWIMPEGTSAQDVLDRAADLAPVVARLGMNLTLRQHVLLYGNRRGT